MALTAQQLVDVRYYMGYSVAGNTATAPYGELVYSNVAYFAVNLDTRLANLTPEEEAKITGYFLLNLPLREAEVQAASDNLDTAIAAVWTRNASEVSDRRGLYTMLRRELCAFLGFAPGNLLQFNRAVRA
jgi:hypothetical protein